MCLGSPFQSPFLSKNGPPLLEICRFPIQCPRKRLQTNLYFHAGHLNSWGMRWRKLGICWGIFQFFCLPLLYSNCSALTASPSNQPLKQGQQPKSQESLLGLWPRPNAKGNCQWRLSRPPWNQSSAPLVLQLLPNTRAIRSLRHNNF